jgi:hypothetical protein
MEVVEIFVVAVVIAIDVISWAPMSVSGACGSLDRM